jgi:hypothetical protein
VKRSNVITAISKKIVGRNYEASFEFNYPCVYRNVNLFIYVLQISISKILQTCLNIYKYKAVINFEISNTKFCYKNCRPVYTKLTQYDI